MKKNGDMLRVLAKEMVIVLNQEQVKEEISKCTYRQFTTGFFFGPTTHETQIYDNNTINHT